MDIRSQIVRFRNSQRNKVKKNPLRRIGLSFALLFSLIIAILIIVGISIDEIRKKWNEAVEIDLHENGHSYSR